MDMIPPIVFESPIRTCAMSLVAISFSYFAMKGLRRLLFKGRESHPYPPGPPRNFLLGAMKSFPKGFPLDGLNEWAATYGIYPKLNSMVVDVLLTLL
jgi:hypothetical protein